jgi:hypothetical protein
MGSSTLNTYFQNMANKIRSKTGKSGLLTPEDMIDEVQVVFDAGAASNTSGKIVSVKSAPKMVGSTWEKITGWPISNGDGSCVWTDGEDIYYSYDSNQYVFDKDSKTWSNKTWYGHTGFRGSAIWSDGTNIYLSNGSSTQKILDKSTSTWTKKTWNGYTDISALYIWTDGEDIYYSDYNKQYILDKSTSTWNAKTWSGLPSGVTPLAGDVWAYDSNICLYVSNSTYILNKSTSTWTKKTWNGYQYPAGRGIWTDGNNIYYTNSNMNTASYILNVSTSTWSSKAFTGGPTSNVSGTYIWTDGDNIYHSNGANHYKLVKTRIGSTK